VEGEVPAAAEPEGVETVAAPAPAPAPPPEPEPEPEPEPPPHPAARFMPPAGKAPELTPGMSADELVKWLEAHGLTDLRVARFDERYEEMRFGRYRFVESPKSLMESICNKPPRGGPHELSRFLNHAQKAIAWLELQAQAARAFAVEEAARPAPPPLPPGDGPLQAFVRRVQQQNLQLREQILPRQVQDRWTWLVDAEKGSAEGQYHAPSHCRSTSPLRVNVRLNGEGDCASCACTNAIQGRCPVMLDALDRLRRGAGGEGDPRLVEGLRLALAQHAWERTLNQLDRVLEQRPVDNSEGPLGVLVEGKAPRVSLVSLVRVAPYRFSPGWKLDRPKDFNQLQPESTAERVAFQIIGAQGLSTGKEANTPVSVLELLAGHPRVFWGELRQATPIRVEVAEASLSARPREDSGETELVVELAGNTYSMDEARLRVCGSSLVDVDERAGRIVVSRTSHNLLNLLNELTRRSPCFPAEAMPALVTRLGKVALRLPVVLQNLPATEVRPGATLPVLQLQRLPTGAVSMRMGLRPHLSQPLTLPGVGGLVQLIAEEDRVIRVERDSAAEYASLNTLREQLGLPPSDDWSWELSSGPAMLDVLLRLREMGSTVRAEWTGRRPRLKRLKASADIKVQVGAQADWFGVSGGVELEDGIIPLSALLQAIRERQDWVQVDDDRWIRIDETLRQTLGRLAGATRHTAHGDLLSPVAFDVIQELSSTEVQVSTSEAWTRKAERLRQASTLEITLPPVNAQLRSYQTEGVTWMMRLAHWAGGAVLADDMGLGKTLQALTVLASRARFGPALVVAPTSVGFNWLREAAQFTPELRVRLMRGADRRLDADSLGAGDVVVTSYDLLSRDIEDLGRRWATLVLDEAHAIKNASTQRFKAASAVRADFRLGLTGTPLENRLSELWSLFAVILPDLFGPFESFRERFVRPIELNPDTAVRAEVRGWLSRIVRPFLLRRTKLEVARELPPKTEVRLDVELSPAERQRYDLLRKSSLQALAGLDPNLTTEQRRFQVLTALTRLRQLACHPQLVDPQAPDESSKLSRLVEHCLELKEEGRRALVFSQFTAHLDIAGPALAREGIQMLRLDGSTPEKQRRDIVTRFQAGEGDLLLLSLKAGGVGINLTAATDVVLLDPWWNPAVEDQAADRAHRIGQTQAVNVWRLVARGTVEEQILALHAAKRELVSGVLEGTGQSGSLSVDELMSLLNETGP
jgi:superfamily II DNA or RNA helicase